MATVEKLGGWDDESAGKIVEKTNQRLGQQGEEMKPLDMTQENN